VDDHDPPRAILVGMGILLGRLPVGRPARVTDPPVAIEGLISEARGQTLQLARGTSTLQAATADDGDTGRIVATILEAPQSVEDQRNCITTANVADDATHGSPLGSSTAPCVRPR
jgi:hypothetical protein